jgi:hypothetical protein
MSLTTSTFYPKIKNRLDSKFSLFSSWIFIPFFNKQATTNPPGNPSYWFRHKSKGSWPLSTVDYGWASSDTTAEVTKVSTRSLF